jgi:hypothetical protein
MHIPRLPHEMKRTKRMENWATGWSNPEFGWLNPCFSIQFTHQKIPPTPFQYADELRIKVWPMFGHNLEIAAPQTVFFFKPSNILIIISLTLYFW